MNTAAGVTQPVQGDGAGQRHRRGVVVDAWRQDLTSEVHAGIVTTGPRPAASLNAVVRSFCACRATASAAWKVPLVTSPGGKPTIALPGAHPTSPEMVVGPVLVTV